MTGGKVFLLYGAVQPIGIRQGFLILVFGEKESLWIQEIDSEGCITDFTSCHFPPTANFILSSNQIVRQVGDEAFYGFGFEDGTTIIDVKRRLQEGLLSRLGEIEKFPFLHLEVLHFLEKRNDITTAINAAAKRLHSINPRVAQEWKEMEEQQFAHSVKSDTQERQASISIEQVPEKQESLAASNAKLSNNAKKKARNLSIRLVLADSYPSMLEGLLGLFRKEADIKVVARCGTGEETLQAVQKHRPDVLIFDIPLPGKDGFAVLQEIRRRQLPTRAILLTSTLSDTAAVKAIRSGINGIVLKEMAPSLLVQCVRKVYAGQQWIERRSMGRVLDKLVQQDGRKQEIERVLTGRELDIVRLIKQGLRNKEIAQQLFLSEGTIKTHLHNIYTKLPVTNRLALIHYAHTEELE